MGSFFAGRWKGVVKETDKDEKGEWRSLIDSILAKNVTKVILYRYVTMFLKLITHAPTFMKAKAHV